MTTAVMDAVCWDGSVARFSLFVLAPGGELLSEADFDVRGMRPDRVRTYPLEGKPDWMGSADPVEYDLVFEDMSLDFPPYLHECLRRACSRGGAAVAWLAFEGSFHFDHLLTEDVAEQIYGYCLGDGPPAVAWDAEVLKSPSWAQQILEARSFLEEHVL